MGASGLGALLVKEGFLTEQDRVTITKTCGQGSWAFAKCILSTGLLDEDELSAFFAERTKYVVAPKNLLDRLDPGIVEQVDRRMVSRLEVLPLEIDHHRITVAVADPLDKSTLKQLEFFTGLEVVPVIAPLSQIHEGLNRLNPEFKARPTALTNFLRNHAGAAWIKQKIVEEGDVEIPKNKPARGGALENYDEDQVEDVALDEEIDAMDDSSDLNDIDASGLDEGVGNSDFDDIDLEDSGGDLELAPGDDPDHGLDDAGLDVDDPFDNFEDAPKKAKSAAASPDADLEGLEAGGNIEDDLWPDADDEPAKPVAQAKAKPKAPGPTADDLMGDDDFGLDDEPAKPAKQAAAASDDLWPDADDEPAKPVAQAKAKPKSPGPTADDLMGDDDFGLDDEPAKPAKQAATPNDDLLDDFGLDDEPAKPAKKVAASDDDFSLADESDADDLMDDKPAKPAKKAAASDDDFGLGDESDADDLLDDKPAKKAAASDDEFGLGDGSDTDDLLDEKPAKKAAASDDEFGLGDEDVSELAGDLDLDAAPAKPAKKAAPADMDDDLLGETPDLSFEEDDDLEKDASPGGLEELGFGDDAEKLDDDLKLGSSEGEDDDLGLASDEPAPQRPSAAPRAEPQAPRDSTRMAQKPAILPTVEDPEDLVGLEFADDDETSVSLRKAVHEEGSEPEFRDPNFDDEPEETRIDLHAAIDDDSEFGLNKVEDTNIRLHPEEKPKAAQKPKAAPADPLEDLAMGFDDDAIDELADIKPNDGPGIDDLTLDAELDDIPIAAPRTPARAGGRSPSIIENGSVASLTATAKANEALLRMSLCFDRDTALEIAREYLPQISATGCLVNIGKTTEALASWRSGAQSAQGKAAVYQRLAKAAKPNQWSEIPVSAQDDFGSVKAISVYKIQKDDGRILLLAGDYPKDDDSLREVLTSLAVQLGAK